MHLGALHGLMQNESLPLNGQGVKGRWQHLPADLCLVAERQGSWPHRRQPLHHTAPSLGSYQLWRAPRVMEAGAIARAKPRRPAAGGTICFSSGVNREEEKI